MYYEIRFFKAFFLGANFCNGDKIFGKILSFVNFQHNFDLNCFFFYMYSSFFNFTKWEKKS
jgi:hypothetical protein